MIDGYNIRQLISDIHEADTDKTLTDKNTFIYELVRDYVTVGGTIDSQRIRSFLQIVRSNPNLVSSTVIKKLISNGIIDKKILLGIGVKPEFVEALEDPKLQSQAYPAPDGSLDKIGNTSTEVYFWGIPASGKTCAIGALFSVLKKSDLSRVKNIDFGDCQGREYMEKLTTMFAYDKEDDNKAGNVMPLPSGTSIEHTYELYFEVTDNNKQIHPITFIDMAGELIRCMYKKNRNRDLTEQEKTALQTITNVLKDNRTTNQKLHIFVLEYGGENRQYEGVPQTQYLEEAIKYLSNIKCENGETFNVFQDRTDGIYLLVTQTDKLGKPDEDLKEHVKRYLNGSNNYDTIANKLDTICEKNNINGGKLAIILFSLGEVCFRDYCHFRPRFSKNVLEIILSHVYGYHKWMRIPWINYLYQKLTS